MISMEFRIADTFTDGLARLTGEEQKAVKTSAFDLQLEPSAPGSDDQRAGRSQKARARTARQIERAPVPQLAAKVLGSLATQTHHRRRPRFRAAARIHPRALSTEMRRAVRAHV